MIVEIDDVSHWRTAARTLLAAERTPSSVRFVPRTAGEPLLPGLFAPDETPQHISTPPRPFKVPSEFIRMCQSVAMHREQQRWQWLYEALWRLTHGEPQLLQMATDDLVMRLQQMVKEIRRDCHKMKAFVRFRLVKQGDDEHYIAWHRPDHTILRGVAPFFSRRFAGMHWTIFTPDESVEWDGGQLHYSPGVPRSSAPKDDELEDLWKTYYGSTFNPARIKLAMMRKEMPVRHWPTLPESQVIDQLLADAPERVARMVAHAEGQKHSAADYLPAERDIDSLRQAATGCRGCDLCQSATQTVFGEGRATSQIMIVGEQPGDSEDLLGRPFVGPAGQLLDQAFAEAGLDRAELYLTNAVKHFHFQEQDLSGRGKQRLHKKPSSRHIAACRPWLESEVAAVQPRVLVCLGATALEAIVGRHVRLGDVRGQFIATRWCEITLATWHPAAILRALPEQRESRLAELVSDLAVAAQAGSGDR